MKTYTPTPKDIHHQWYLIDAEGMILGRLASAIATIVRGKHKTIWAPHADVGDFVVVVNADKIQVTGRKSSQKTYTHFTGYPGGLRATPFRRLKEKKPEFIIREAVRGMLPHNKLGRKLLRKVKIYASPEHPHIAQQPQIFKIAN